MNEGVSQDGGISATHLFDFSTKESEDIQLWEIPTTKVKKTIMHIQKIHISVKRFSTLSLAMSGQGMELPLRGSNLAESGGRPASTLLELAAKEKPTKPYGRNLAILMTYTLARIAANFTVGGSYVTAMVRPMITGLGIYCFIRPNSRFSPKLRLHVWSWRIIVCLAAFPFDPSCTVRLWQHPSFGWVIAVSEILCIIQNMCMTNLKIRAFGWHCAARCCKILMLVGCGFVTFTILSIMLGYYHPFPLDFHSLFMASYRAWFSWPGLCFLASFAVILLQSLSIFRCVCQAATQARRKREIRMVWTACSLFINAVLVFVGPILSFIAASSFGRCLDGGHCWVVNFNICFQVLSSLLLSGMTGTGRFDLKDFKMLAEMSGFGLVSRRIPFLGKINPRATDCIVSFPGKYAELWDKAVKATQDEEFPFSLANVFLTDKASGLGQHASVPHLEGGCWCHTIYGDTRPSAYLSVVDVEDIYSGNEQDVLSSKFEDAKTMGQHLIIRRNQSELEWRRELSEALVYAEELCTKNSGRAPWGCQWFEAWRLCVEEAVRLNQTLHVFYFESKVGQGKMEWQDLCNERARDIARKDTGLGASQTAEVAYLDHKGLPYEEHDINDFYKILQIKEFGSGLASSTSRLAFHGKINPGTRDCIVSFPGIYNKLWHKTVQAAKDKAPAFSLACVFLTDKASGLGQHASVPDRKGGCWCHTIYGDMQPSAYLSVVYVNELKQGENEQEHVDFKRADAKAMGQVLVIKRNQSDEEWCREYSQALVHAEELCTKNGGRAPWGCRWFEAWRLRVEEAKGKKQIFHVFYFESKVGQGKMNWEDLCNERARKARNDTGLGESQTAEVAYLDHKGLPYEEHDINDFYKIFQIKKLGERLAFPGKINPRATDCIVSFPGIYNKLWHKTVKATQDEEFPFSLANVFLTDKASGLGQHASVPHLEGGCWCHTIYGDTRPSAYLSVVDVGDIDYENEQDVLDFKRADAKTMGQHLIIKRNLSELEWRRELSEALVYAEELCTKNSGRAPWGCQWFEAWRLCVEEAVRLNQTLHVFYFESKVGQGKMNWEDLCNERARDIARKNTGLGESQTAEVAYLDHKGLPYEEHDILDFERVMFGKRASSHAAVVPENGHDSTAAV